MKKAMCIAATTILILSLAGCAETAGPAPLGTNAAPTVNEDVSQESTATQDSAAALFSDSKDVTAAPETENAAEGPAAETTPAPCASTEAPKETTLPQETAAPPKTAETTQPEKPVNRSEEPAEPQSTEQPKPQETQPPATPEPDPPPAQTQPPVETSPQPTPEETKPKSAYDYEFDIEAIKADCIAIGQGMGLAVDSSLTPGNAAWWNPVTASQGNQGTALKQSLESYITFHTTANLSAYGMDEITSFNIYCEARGNGSYSIYFLFA